MYPVTISKNYFLIFPYWLFLQIQIKNFYLVWLKTISDLHFTKRNNVSLSCVWFTLRSGNCYHNCSYFFYYYHICFKKKVRKGHILTNDWQRDSKKFLISPNTKLVILAIYHACNKYEPPTSRH